jgi:hypothetical protein
MRMQPLRIDLSKVMSFGWRNAFSFSGILVVALSSAYVFGDELALENFARIPSGMIAILSVAAGGVIMFRILASVKVPSNQRVSKEDFLAKRQPYAQTMRAEGSSGRWVQFNSASQKDVLFIGRVHADSELYSLARGVSERGFCAILTDQFSEGLSMVSQDHGRWHFLAIEIDAVAMVNGLEEFVEEMIEFRTSYPGVTTILLSSSFSHNDWSGSRRQVADLSLRLPCRADVFADELPLAKANNLDWQGRQRKEIED